MNDILNFFKAYENGIDNYVKIVRSGGAGLQESAKVYAFCDKSMIPFDLVVPNGTIVHNGLREALLSCPVGKCIVCLLLPKGTLISANEKIILQQDISLTIIELHNFRTTHIDGDKKITVSACLYYPLMRMSEYENEMVLLNANKWSIINKLTFDPNAKSIRFIDKNITRAQTFDYVPKYVVNDGKIILNRGDKVIKIIIEP